MIYRLAAEGVMLVHFLIVAFIVMGGWWVLQRPRWLWAHVVAFAWGLLVVVNQWTCPLTPLEQDLRLAGDTQAYEGGFIAHYIEPLVYPDGLPRSVKLMFGALILIMNLVLWRLAWVKSRGRNPETEKQVELK